MKLMKLMMCAAMLSLAAVACDKDDEPQQEQPTPPPAQNSYLGVVTVDQNDGTTYKRQNVEVKYDMTDVAGSKLDIYMYKVKFAEAMPMELDMTIPAVDFTVTGERIDLSGDGIIPLAMGGKFPAYTITGLRGTIENNIMTLSMMCGEYPLSYKGVLMSQEQ